MNISERNIAERVPAGWRHLIKRLNEVVDVIDAYENAFTGELDVRWSPVDADDYEADKVFVDSICEIASRTCSICGRDGTLHNLRVRCDEHANLRHRETILRNSARCNSCGSEIESTHRHDFVRCQCGAIAVDGGQEYLRRIGSGWTDTSVTIPNFKPLKKFEWESHEKWRARNREYGIEIEVGDD